MVRSALCSLSAVALAFVSACASEAPMEQGYEVEVQGATHHFVLRSDAGVREGPNAFDLEVERIDGGALGPSASVSVIVRMPAMTHGDQDVEVTRLEGSSFAVDDVVFAMPGTWELEVSVEEAAAIDRATFKLDVP